MKILMCIMFLLLFIFTALMIAVLINDAEVEELEKKVIEKIKRDS